MGATLVVEGPLVEMTPTIPMEMVDKVVHLMVVAIMVILVVVLLVEKILIIQMEMVDKEDHSMAEDKEVALEVKVEAWADKDKESQTMEAMDISQITVATISSIGTILVCDVKLP